MDVGKSFTYVFEDEKWISKIVIGGLISLVPIVNLAAWGYFLETLRRVAEGEKHPLPDWGEFGDFFVKGLVFFIAIFAYALPAIFLGFCVAIFSAIAGDGRGAGGLFVIFTLPLACLIFFYALALAVFWPAIAISYASSGQFAGAFAWGWMYRLIRDNLGSYLVAVVMSWIAGIIASVGVIACFIGVIFTNFWAYLV
ncbi:MAG: DUF4013 domain-containing protein, partial [Anaerolineae bacterium]